MDVRLNTLSWLALTGLTGWLSTTLSGNIAEVLEEIYEIPGEFSLLLIAVHVTGVFAMSFIERQDLVKFMIDGKNIWKSDC